MMTTLSSNLTTAANTVLCNHFPRELLGGLVSETAQNYQFGEATFRSYYEPLRTLNVELVLIVPFGA